MFTFIFVTDVPSFAFVLVVYLYVCNLHSKFAAISSLHFDTFGQLPFICKNTSMVQHFRFMRYLCKCYEAEVFGYDEML